MPCTVISDYRVVVVQGWGLVGCDFIFRIDNKINTFFLEVVSKNGRDVHNVTNKDCECGEV